ncbi:hypothetical protein FOA52_003942 [Chlamydomonas sp. UWO 241]|nr:hypothetical protein FOA52_003942 [Chlamydomonas sp. UWO 241]
MRSLLATRAPGSLTRTGVPSRSPLRVAPFPLHGATTLARSFPRPEGGKCDHEEDERRVETAGVVPDAGTRAAPTAAHETRVAAALQAAESLAKTAVTLASQDQGHAARLKVEQVCGQIENVVVAVDSVHAQLEIFGDQVEQLDMGGIAAKLGLLIDTTDGMQMQGSELEQVARLQLEATESTQQSLEARLTDIRLLLGRMEGVAQLYDVFVGDCVRVKGDVRQPYYALAGVTDQLGNVVEVDASQNCLIHFPKRRLLAKMYEVEVVPVCRELELVPVEVVCAQLLIDTEGTQQDGEGMQPDGEGQDKSRDMKELERLVRLQLEASERMEESQAAQAAAYDKVLHALAKIAVSSAETAVVVQGMQQSQAAMMAATEKLVKAAEASGHSDSHLTELKQLARMQMMAATEKLAKATEASGHSDAHLKELKQLARMQLDAAAGVRKGLADVMAAVEKRAASTTQAGRRSGAYIEYVRSESP